MDGGTASRVNSFFSLLDKNCFGMGPRRLLCCLCRWLPVTPLPQGNAPHRAGEPKLLTVVLDVGSTRRSVSYCQAARLTACKVGRAGISDQRGAAAYM